MKRLRPRPTRYALDIIRLVRDNLSAGRDAMEGVIRKIEVKYGIRYASIWAWLEAAGVRDDLQFGKTKSLERLLQKKGSLLATREIKDVITGGASEREAKIRTKPSLIRVAIDIPGQGRYEGELSLVV